METVTDLRYPLALVFTANPFVYVIASKFAKVRKCETLSDRIPYFDGISSKSH